MPKFEVVSDYQPAGDQPRAIQGVADAVGRGESDVVLLGVTGSGKTYTASKIVEAVQKPTLVMAPNKTLAAQLANEFREFFPRNAVEYFVSYYDYYQPEAYVPSSDTYIEKDSSVNEEVERLRHRATTALLSRRDVLIVASVSCIYGLGAPDEYEHHLLMLQVGHDAGLEASMRRLVDLQYERNDLNFVRGKFRVRGDTLEVFPADAEIAFRVEFFGDTVDRITKLDPLTGEVVAELQEAMVFPNSHYVASPHGQGDRDDRGGAGRATCGAGAPEQAAGSPAAADAHHLRPGDDARDRVLLRHRELLAPHRRAWSRRDAEHAAGLLPRRVPADRRRVPRHHPADRRHVRGRPLPQADPGGSRLPPPERAGQPAVDLRGVPRPHPPDPACVRDPGAVREAHGFDHRRAGDPTDRTGRPGGRGQADQGPDRRPDRGDPRPRRGERAGARHHADQEDVRGPHRLPAGVRHPGAVPALRDRHRATHPHPARAAHGRVRCARGDQPAARGPRPPRGVPGGHPRRRQGGLPALGDLVGADHRARRPQHQRPGHHVRRQPDRLHAPRHRRDQPPAQDPGGPQRRARRRPADDPQEGRRHHPDGPGRGGGDAVCGQDAEPAAQQTAPGGRRRGLAGRQ